jgi:hypothetical protein
MSTTLEAIQEDGRLCAVRGGQYTENPFIERADSDPEYLAWNRGFKVGRTPDPLCPNCRGRGRIALRVTWTAVPDDNEGVTVDDLCNSKKGRAPG